QRSTNGFWGKPEYPEETTTNGPRLEGTHMRRRSGERRARERSTNPNVRRCCRLGSACARRPWTLVPSTARRGCRLELSKSFLMNTNGKCSFESIQNNGSMPLLLALCSHCCGDC